MNRRAFLRRASGLGALALAGCTGAPDDQPTNGSDGGAGGTDTPDETKTGTPVEPAITSQSIRTLASDCMSGETDETATVTMDDAAQVVTVSGTLQTSDPCHEATLERVQYDPDSDTLRIDVGTERTGGACVQCIGAVDYEATVEFTGGMPETVAISHQGALVATRGGDSTSTETATPKEKTSAATPKASLTDASLTVTDVSNSEKKPSPTIQFESETNTVVIRGTIQGENGCKTAALGNVGYDADSDTLSVNVVTKDRENAGACTQALVYIDYVVTVEFEGSLPGSAELSHNGRSIVSAAHASAAASAPDGS